MNYTNRIFPAAIVATMFICVVTLAGCGGGGSSHSPIIPDPVIPDPVIPDPVIPDPVIPDPVIPDPVIPDPVIPDPVIPDPVIPDPVIPDPVIPDPVIPDPVIPDPVIPDPGTLGAMDDYYQPGGGFSAFIGDTTPVTDSGLSTLTYSAGLNLLNRRVEGPRVGDPSVVLPLPPTDIRQAWRDGWTGEGVNIVVMDGLGEDNDHGYNVLLSALQVSPRANLVGLDIGSFVSTERPYRDVSDNDLVSSRQAQVVNWSLGGFPSNWDFFLGETVGSGRPPTPAEITAARNDSFNTPLGFRELFEESSRTDAIHTADAVVIKASGNEIVDSGWIADNIAFVRDSSTGPRALIVGALDDWAQNGGARIASYSNFAGDNTEIQQRFLVEYGGSPLSELSVSCPSGVPGCLGLGLLLGNADTAGTSFAAPRVAGHAALLRDKFPNLIGSQSADILLDTATTEGIICHPSCPVRTYGQGRVDIGRALAPVGTMR